MTKTTTTKKTSASRPPCPHGLAPRGRCLKCSGCPHGRQKSKCVKCGGIDLAGLAGIGREQAGSKHPDTGDGQALGALIDRTGLTIVVLPTAAGASIEQQRGTLYPSRGSGAREGCLAVEI